jgi:hypothetical protein
VDVNKVNFACKTTLNSKSPLQKVSSGWGAAISCLFGPVAVAVGFLPRWSHSTPLRGLIFSLRVTNEK